MYHDVSLPFLSILNGIAFSPFISFFLFSPLDSFDFLHEKKYFIFLIFGLVLLVFLCYISISKKFAPCIIVS